MKFFGGTVEKSFHVLNFHFLLPLQKRPFHSWSVSSRLVSKTPGSISCSMSSAAVASQASFSVQSLSTNEPVVSVDWLHANLREPDVKVCGLTLDQPFLNNYDGISMFICCLFLGCLGCASLPCSLWSSVLDLNIL